MKLRIIGYRKSGNHLAQALMQAGGFEAGYSHSLGCGSFDLHVVRDPRAIIVSWIADFILRRPELDPAQLRPHITTVANGLLYGHGKGKPHWRPWHEFVELAESASSHTASFRDLVTQPREALACIADIGPYAEEHVRQSALLPGSYARLKYRQGDPDGWREVMSKQDATRLAELFRPGMEAAGLWGAR